MIVMTNASSLKSPGCRFKGTPELAAAFETRRLPRSFLVLLESLLHRNPSVRPSCDRVKTAIREGKVCALRHVSQWTLVQSTPVRPSSSCPSTKRQRKSRCPCPNSSWRSLQFSRTRRRPFQRSALDTEAIFSGSTTKAFGASIPSPLSSSIFNVEKREGLAPHELAMAPSGNRAKPTLDARWNIGQESRRSSRFADRSKPDSCIKGLFHST